MVHELVVALEHAGDLVGEGGVGVQAGDLVLVLVGHQLEQVARHGLGQPRGAKRAFRLSLIHI